jgi:hypothetical protein
VTVRVPPWAADAARELPRPLLFATVSGAHLYGFASVDSDLDLRAAHLLPAAEVVGLRIGPQTLQHTGVRDGVELDVVIAAKREAEQAPLPEGAAERLAVDVPRLRAKLEAARDASVLPEQADPTAVDALHDLVVRTRLA